jgi:hypothetical protein
MDKDIKYVQMDHCLKDSSRGIKQMGKEELFIQMEVLMKEN